MSWCDSPCGVWTSSDKHKTHRWSAMIKTVAAPRTSTMIYMQTVKDKWLVSMLKSCISARNGWQRWWRWLQIAVAIVKANIWKAFENNVKRVTYTQCAIAARPRLPRWSDSHARRVVGTFRWYSHRGMVVFHVQGRSVSRPNIFTVLYSNCSWFLVTWLPPSNFNRHMCETDFFGFEFEERRREREKFKEKRGKPHVSCSRVFFSFFNRIAHDECTRIVSRIHQFLSSVTATATLTCQSRCLVARTLLLCEPWM